MDIAEVTRRVTAAASANPGLGNTLKFDFGAAGKVYIDGLSGQNTVSNDDRPADCTVMVEWEDFESMTKGVLDPTMAYLMGRMKVQGDLNIARKLQPFLAKLR